MSRWELRGVLPFNEEIVEFVSKIRHKSEEEQEGRNQGRLSLPEEEGAFSWEQWGEGPEGKEGKGGVKSTPEDNLFGTEVPTLCCPPRALCDP